MNSHQSLGLRNSILFPERSVAGVCQFLPGRSMSGCGTGGIFPHAALLPWGLWLWTARHSNPVFHEASHHFHVVSCTNLATHPPEAPLGACRPRIFPCYLKILNDGAVHGQVIFSQELHQQPQLQCAWSISIGIGDCIPGCITGRMLCVRHYHLFPSAEHTHTTAQSSRPYPKVCAAGGSTMFRCGT